MKDIPTTGWAVTSYGWEDGKYTITFANEIKIISPNIMIDIIILYTYGIYWFFVVMPLVCMGVWTLGEEED